MISDQGLLLHNRATRGEHLTAQEQQVLETWYREQDQAEFPLLEHAVLAHDVTALRHQLEVALQQLALVSQSVNEVMRANNALRRDIAWLQTQLRPQPTGHAA